HGSRALVDHAKLDQVREGHRDGIEPCAGHHRSAEIPHVAGEHGIERVNLVETEPRLQPGLLRPADLASQLRRELLEEKLGCLGKGQDYSHLPRVDLERTGNKRTVSQLEEIRVE